MNLLRPEEIERIEREHARGISARSIVDVFSDRGVRLSEATFRKYVEEIKSSFVVLKNHIDLATRELGEVFDELERIIDERGDERRDRELSIRLRALKEMAYKLIDEVARLGSAVTAKTALAHESIEVH